MVATSGMRMGGARDVAPGVAGVVGSVQVVGGAPSKGCLGEGSEVVVTDQRLDHSGTEPIPVATVLVATRLHQGSYD